MYEDEGPFHREIQIEGVLDRVDELMEKKYPGEWNGTSRNGFCGLSAIYAETIFKKQEVRARAFNVWALQFSARGYSKTDAVRFGEAKRRNPELESHPIMGSSLGHVVCVAKIGQAYYLVDPSFRQFEADITLKADNGEDVNMGLFDRLSDTGYCQLTPDILHDYLAMTIDRTNDEE